MQTKDIREAAMGAVDQSKSFLSKQVDERSTQLGRRMGTIAQDFRKVGDQLRAIGMSGIVAGYVDQSAEAVDRFGRYLEDADSDRLIGDLESIARRQPWAIAAGTLAIGFAASRFLKTTSARRFRSSAEYGRYRSYGYGSAERRSGGQRHAT